MWCQEKVTGDADAPAEETDDSGAAATAGSETDEGISEFESEKLEVISFFSFYISIDKCQ